MAGPCVVRRIRDHFRAQRVQFDVAVALQQVAVVADGTRLVASFPQCPGSAMPIIHVADVAPSQGLHGARDATRGAGRHQQVNVIRHQDVCVHGAAFAPSDFAQILQVTDVVDLDEEARAAIVAALDHVLCNAGKVDAGRTGHGRNPCKTDRGILVFACMWRCRRSPERAVGKSRL